MKLKKITGFEIHLLETAPMIWIRLQGSEQNFLAVVQPLQRYVPQAVQQGIGGIRSEQKRSQRSWNLRFCKQRQFLLLQRQCRCNRGFSETVHQP